MEVRFLERDIALCRIESRTDILSLYLLATETESWVHREILWQEKLRAKDKFEREERGKKRKVKVKLSVKKAYLEEDLKGIRMNGRIIECPKAEELKGRYIGIDLNIGERVAFEGDEETLKKYLVSTPRRWGGTAVLLVVDDREACAVLIRDLPEVLLDKQFGREQITGREERLEIEGQFGSLTDFAIGEAERHNATLIVASSSIFMRKLKRILKERRIKGIRFIEGPYMGNFAGALEVIRSEKFRKTASNTQAALESHLMDEVKRSLIGDAVRYGLEDVLKAIERSRIRSVVATTKYVIEVLEKDRDQLKRTLKRLHRQRRGLLIVHPKGELGEMVGALGGIIAF
ncbi:MAG: hypothetical protein GTN80_05835 [Nitrososphaeria archaeon]|nr:hypothetical protein [Nitrososphaeria archaeon]NIN52670.1 hypothetical protein [Nitrososphaeria archaeon]NIQ33145.1 hypothetical protein [Nitrososphaeria archaeon]